MEEKAKTSEGPRENRNLRQGFNLRKSFAIEKRSETFEKQIYQSHTELEKQIKVIFFLKVNC